MTLSRVEIKRERYAAYKGVLKRKYIRRVAVENCGGSPKRFTQGEPLNLAEYPAICLTDCNEEKAYMLYGNIYYFGPIENNLPQGKGKWAVLRECEAEWAFPEASSVRYGNFEKGIPQG